MQFRGSATELHQKKLHHNLFPHCTGDEKPFEAEWRRGAGVAPPPPATAVPTSLLAPEVGYLVECKETRDKRNGLKDAQFCNRAENYVEIVYYDAISHSGT